MMYIFACELAYMYVCACGSCAWRFASVFLCVLAASPPVGRACCAGPYVSWLCGSVEIHEAENKSGSGSEQKQLIV